MRISATGNNPSVLTSGNRGFTILELMVVLVIMVIITGIAAVSIGPGMKDAKIRTACRMIVSALTYARSNAVSTGVPTRVVFKDGESTSVEMDSPDGVKILTTSSGRLRYLPDNIRITGISKTAGSGDDDSIEFDSLGQAESAIIKVEDKSGSDRYVTVDAFTGLCRIKTYDELDNAEKRKR